MPAKQTRMVEEAFRPGVVMTEAARRRDVHESQLYRWRKLMKATGTAVAEPSSFVAVTITPESSVMESPIAEPRVPLPAPAAPVASPPPRQVHGQPASAGVEALFLGECTLTDVGRPDRE